MGVRVLLEVEQGMGAERAQLGGMAQRGAADHEQRGRHARRLMHPPHLPEEGRCDLRVLAFDVVAES